jgi:hypothetical protein
MQARKMSTVVLLVCKLREMRDTKSYRKSEGKNVLSETEQNNPTKKSETNETNRKDEYKCVPRRCHISGALKQSNY